MTSPAIGVDVGGTKILGIVLDNGEILDRIERPTPSGSLGDLGRGLDVALSDLISELLERETGGRSATVGIGLPGMMGSDGVLLAAPNLRSATGAALAQPLAEHLGVPVVLANDADCAVLAESSLGVAKGHDDVLMATLGTGIGGGIISGGRLVRGGRGYAGEIGHMVLDPGGPLCPCGSRGCWEQFASGTAIGRLGRDAARAGRLAGVLAAAGDDPEAVRGEQVTAAAQAGDLEALVLVDEVAWWLARGLVNLVAVLDPSIIVIGGGLSANADLLIEPVRRLLPTMVEGGRDRPVIEVAAAELGPDAGAIGAALLGNGER